MQPIRKKHKRKYSKIFAFIKGIIPKGGFIKAQIRKIAKARLLGSRHSKNYAQREVLDEIERIILQRKAKRVLLYCPLSLELDISPLLWRLKKVRGIEVFVPYIQGDEFRAVLFRLPLIRADFGVLQPKVAYSHTQKIDVIVAPSIAWDKELGRIGFGKGYYDRFCAKLTSKPYIIFVSYLSFFVKKKITQDFDIRGDIALSPKCRLRRKKSGIVMDRPYNSYSFNLGDFEKEVLVSQEGD